MATINLGRVKPVFRGAYNNSTAYVVDDIVTSSDETFICILASTGNATSNATYWTKLAAKGTNGTDGTDVGTVITTQGDILYRDGSGLARLGAGTSGQVLQTGGTGANPSWTTMSSDAVLLHTTSSLSGSTVNIDNVFTNDYKTYKVFVEGMDNASADYEPRIQFRYGGASGSSGSSSNYMNVAWRVEKSSSANGSSIGLEHWNDSSFRFFQTAENGGTNQSLNMEMTIFNPYANAGTYFQFKTNGWDSSGQWFIVWNGGGVYRDSTVITGISFLSGAGSFDSGLVKIYGLK